jgi:hypothetical protein
LKQDSKYESLKKNSTTMICMNHKITITNFSYLDKSSFIVGVGDVYKIVLSNQICECQTRSNKTYNFENII